MSTIIISSTQDTASTNIKNSLLNNSSWEENNNLFEIPVYKSQNFSDLYLITIKDKKIIHENLEIQIKNHLNINPSKAIFISRHRSKSGEPTLTTHPIGNYGVAKFGGKTQTLSPAMPHLMTTLLRIIRNNAKKANLNHNICFEVTHHGPYMSIPTLFAEVGSNEEEWAKKKPSEIIAKSIINLLESQKNIEKSAKDIPILVGIGGGHYAPRFTDVAFEKQIAFGHMIPTYHINEGNINPDIIQKTINASGSVHGVYIHRKALKKSQVTQFKNWCNELDVPVVSSNDFSDFF